MSLFKAPSFVTFAQSVPHFVSMKLHLPLWQQAQKTEGLILIELYTLVCIF
jgi:hypothetical protein